MPNESTPYTLVIAEKPDAAAHIARALDSNCQFRGNRSSGYWVAKRDNTEYVVCPASGHLFNLKGKRGTSNIYPIFDLYWADFDVFLRSKINLFNVLAKNAAKFVVACDYDIEGDTIGYNIVKYACKVEPRKATRVVFSTLVREDILSAFNSAKPVDDWPMAVAGRARHLVDFLWGINVSRALSLAGTGDRYTKLSIGRVQGPTLNYVYQRNMERNLHLPIPYWRVTATGSVGDKTFELDFDHNCNRRAEAETVKRSTEHKDGIIDVVNSHRFLKPPPVPFNLSELQHEAFEILRISPSVTLKLAESLYLKALISYPRTNSQRLPPTIGYDRILHGLAQDESYSKFVLALFGRKPVQGRFDDPAHPAIFPTGLHAVNLDRQQSSLYDLIVRRFLAAFAKPSIKEKLNLQVINNGYRFMAEFGRTLYSGFTAIYHFKIQRDNWFDIELKEGMSVSFGDVNYTEEFTQPPPYYNFGSLLSKMEKDEIGTKATRADIIDVLYKRGYVTGKNIQITDLGTAVIEAAQTSCPEMISTETTRELERDLVRVEEDVNFYEMVVSEAASKVLRALESLEVGKKHLSETMLNRYRSVQQAKRVLGPCPVCKHGALIMIKSRKSGKRFVGCTDYTVGCKASAPLPQRGIIRNTHNACKACGWPIVLVYFSRKRYPWRICINMNCPRKRDRELQKTKSIMDGGNLTM